jgi:hypothetical protein
VDGRAHLHRRTTLRRHRQHGRCPDDERPGDASPVWSTTDVDGSSVIWDVSCPTTTLCVAGDVNGAVLSGVAPAAPTVTGVVPWTGPTAGGTAVIVTGTGLTGATKVLFGPVAATNVTVVSSTQLTATSPPQAASTRNVFVTTPAGTSAWNAADIFTYK